MSWNTDIRFPKFEVEGIKFMLTWQEDDFGLSVMVLAWDGSQWVGWGGQPNARNTIMENVTDEKIMAHGSLREFLLWCCDEALARARLKARLPLPDPNNRIARMKYNMLQSIDWNTERRCLEVLPAPLP